MSETERAITRLRASLVDDGITEFAHADPIEDLRMLLAEYDRIRAPAATSWECMGRKQVLPEPGECNWPDCGCDPHATKVIESLLEQGWGPRAGVK